MRVSSRILATVVTIAALPLTPACSSDAGGTGSLAAATGTGTSSVVTITPSHPVGTPPTGITGSFCPDAKRQVIAAAQVAASLRTFSPAELRAAVDADLRLETTLAAEAPAEIRPDVLAAGHAHQFEALARAGYDLSKVKESDYATTPLQKTALARVRSYLISRCNFDPWTVASTAPTGG